MNNYFKMVDTFPFRPIDVETHSTTFGIILCTGRNCLGCNPENVGLQGGIQGFEVDQIDFEKDEKQEEDSEIKTWIMNPVMVTERQLRAGVTATMYDEDGICNGESKNFVQTSGHFASAMRSHSTSKNDSFDDYTFSQCSRILQRDGSNEILHGRQLGKHKPERELNNNDLDNSIERLPRYSDSQEKIIQREKERLLRHADSHEKITEIDIEKRLPKHSDTQGKAVHREIKTQALDVLDSRVNIVNRSTLMLKLCTVHCLRFRRNITSLDLKITDIGYALEDQLGTTVNVLEIERRDGGWKLWVKGENTRDELLRDGLLVGFRLHRLEEVEIATSQGLTGQFLQ